MPGTDPLPGAEHPAGKNIGQGSQQEEEEGLCPC